MKKVLSFTKKHWREMVILIMFIYIQSGISKVITNSDFPAWDVFLAKTDPIKRYETWPEAATAIVALGIKNQKEYWARYKEDTRLVGSPHTYYKDFPGYNVYLGLKYRLCSEASQAAIALGIQTRRDYEKNYKKDPKLLIDPHRRFPDFPGWEKFLGKV